MLEELKAWKLATAAMQTMETDGVDGVRPGHWSDGATITHKANSDGTEANVWRPGDEDAAPLEPEPEPEPEPAVSGRAGGEGSAGKIFD